MCGASPGNLEADSNAISGALGHPWQLDRARGGPGRRGGHRRRRLLLGARRLLGDRPRPGHAARARQPPAGRAPPSAEDVARVPSLVGRFGETTASFAWTAGYLAGRGWLPWLAELPLEQRLTLPDGTRLLGVHAAPGTAHGEGIRPTHSDEQLAELLSSAEADLVLVGHTHWALDRTVYDLRVVNLGSVSNPLAPDLRASYALIEADRTGYRLEQRRVEYDHAAVIAALQAVGHPAEEFIAAHQRGERRPPWA
jgi:diadenosine tetraphosphatase ApaH/serine/threonine PP2A family protein phosphatase